MLKTLRENASSADRDAMLPDDNVTSLADAGLLHALVPAHRGGLGFNVETFSQMALEIGGACPSTACVWVMHCQQIHAVMQYGSPAIIEATLELLERKRLLVSVTTERTHSRSLFPGLTSVETALLPIDGGYRLARDAPVVSAVRHAGAFLVTMRSAPESTTSDVSLVFARAEDLNLEVGGPPLDLVGMRGTESTSLRLGGSVAGNAVVGGPGGFRRILDTFGPLGYVGWSALWIGGAREALRFVAGSGGRRLVRELPFADGLVLERIGRARMQLELAHSMCHSIARQLDERVDAPVVDSDIPFKIRVNLLKVAASELAFDVVDRVVDLAGFRHGYQRGGAASLERLWRDIRAARLTTRNEPLLLASGQLTMLDAVVPL